jgi:hypothetical protein
VPSLAIGPDCGGNRKGKNNIKDRLLSVSLKLTSLIRNIAAFPIQRPFNKYRNA